jgi:hypothetical protein
LEIAAAKLKKFKLPSSGQILAELIQARDETLLSEIHKLINSTGIALPYIFSPKGPCSIPGATNFFFVAVGLEFELYFAACVSC